MIWTIVIGILLLFLCWLLFTPIFLYINTGEKEYSAGLKGILYFKFLPDDDQIFCVRITVVFYSINFYPLKKKEEKPKADSKVKKTKKKKKRLGYKAIWLFLKISRKTLKSFKLKKLYLNIDTDDVITNAYLIPVFANLHRNNTKLYVNYSGDFNMIINVENNIFRMLVVSIYTYFKHKKIF